MQSAAESLTPVVEAMMGGPPPVRIEFWDGSALDADPAWGAPGSLVVRSVDALRRIAWSPNELGICRAYVAGDLDVTGDVHGVLDTLNRRMGGRDRPRRLKPRAAWQALAAARGMGALGRPPEPPAHEARLRGWRHTLHRDAGAIQHHYDTGNEFYEVVLGPSMTYSCARFAHDGLTLEDAQAAKHDLVARKLGLHERRGVRLLDVGCGWGSMAIHAAANYGADVVGITISAAQAKLARERVEAAGLGERVDIRLQDYRELGDEQFDAISSIGMSEHVGSEKIDTYFAGLRHALRPKGRLLNHAITAAGGSRLGRRSFMGRYVFPDGELIDVGRLVLSMEEAGLEVRDVESLREHYQVTLRRWVANLDAGWERAVEAADEARARIWRLYMAAAAVGFGDGGISIHQILGVVPDVDGASAMPRTRAEWG